MRLLSRIELLESSVKNLFKDVYKGHIDLSNKCLSRLPDDLPTEVTSYFSCSNNKLSSLEGCPDIIGRVFYTNDNNLKNLKGAPSKVSDDYWCIRNNLESLEGLPKEIGGDLYCGKQKNGKVFTVEEIKAVCKVGGVIHVE